MTTTDLTPEKLVAIARHIRGQSQAELAARLSELTGDTWQPHHVGAIENGRRRLRVSELATFCAAQGVEPTWYMGQGIAGLVAETGGEVASVGVHATGPQLVSVPGRTHNEPPAPTHIGPTRPTHNLRALEA